MAKNEGLSLATCSLPCCRYEYLMGKVGGSAVRSLRVCLSCSCALSTPVYCAFQVGGDCICQTWQHEHTASAWCVRKARPVLVRTERCTPCAQLEAESISWQWAFAPSDRRGTCRTCALSAVKITSHHQRSNPHWSCPARLCCQS